MKSLLVKLGKIFGTIKRDGLFLGSQRILDAFRLQSKFMKKLSGGDVLFIASGVGDGALYRSHHVAEELNFHGFKSSVTLKESSYLQDYAAIFKVFVFQRVFCDEKVKRFIEEIKRQNKKIIFETDDLNFDARYFEKMNFIENANLLERKQYEKGLGEEILNDPYVEVCTTTTSFLAEKLSQKNKKVFIIPNKLSEKDLEVTQRLLNIPKPEIRDNSVKLGYFSGTMSHNKDFAAIADVLLAIMEKYPNVELFLVGPLDLENKLAQKFKGRIKQFSYVPREKHFENISKIDINLVPLEPNNPFCEAKSELKFFEAGILKVPTVATKNQTFSEAITDGEDGFLAAGKEEWVEKLSQLIEDENLRTGMGEQAREKALRDFTVKNSHNEKYYSFLRDILGKTQ